MRKNRKKVRVCVLGAGSWGTTLSVVLSEKKNTSVILWSVFKKHAEYLRAHRVNREYLNIRLPECIDVESSL